MGYHCLPEACEDFGPSSLVSIIENLQLRPSQVKRLSGNSMHCPVRSAFMLYMLANTVPRTQATVVRSLKWEPGPKPDDTEEQVWEAPSVESELDKEEEGEEQSEELYSW